MNKQKNFFQEDNIDFKALLYKFGRRWYFFVIALVLGYYFQKVYLHYQEPIYQVGTTMLIKDESAGMRRLGGMELYDRKNLYNEIGIIKSFDMMYKVLSNLDFDVSYYNVGSIRTTEWYKNAPFRVELDSASYQLVNVPFYITILSGEKYKLEANASGAEVYDVNRSTTEDRVGAFNIEKVLKFGEPFHWGDKLGFTVYLQNPYYRQEDTKMFFRINDRNRLAQSYKNRLGIGPANQESTILNLFVSGPLLSKDIDFLNKVTETYIQSGLEDKLQIADNTIKFIDDQITGVVDNLKNTEGEMEAFRTTHKTMNLGTSAQEAYQKLEGLENEKSQLQLQLKYYDYIQEYIRSNRDIGEIVVPSAIGVGDPVLGKLISDLINQKSERTQMAASSTNKNPYLIALDRKIEHTLASLEESLNSIKSGTLVRMKDLNQRIAHIERTVSTLPKTERMLLDIQRRFNLNDHLYNFLLERKAEAGITRASTKADNRVLDKASSLNAGKIAPKEDVIKTVTYMIALALPFLIIVLMDFFNDKVQSKEDLEKRTDIPVLGMVGHSKKRTNLVVHEQPKSSISEAFRSIRVNMQYLATDKPNKVIAITSSISGEGKTFSAINLASVFAISGKKTVLIGGDLRKPKIYNDFNLSNSIGLSSFLADKAQYEEIINPTNVPHLDIIISGPIPPNPAELLQLPKMDALIAALKKSYDYIIIDTPPVGLVADAFLFMKFSDINLYIVRHDYTNKKMLDKIDNLYTEGKIKDINIIVNDLKDRDARYGYGYTYGYGYYKNYGYYEEEDSSRFNWKRMLGRKKSEV